MTASEIQGMLEPGDCLLYRPKGFFGTLIKVKNWHRIAHCEMYVGDSQSVASRDGKGVARYPWRDSDLAYVLRPDHGLNWEKFSTWFLTVNGQKYDWWGLARFTVADSIPTGKNDKMFCSEFLTRAYRALDAHVFNDYEDADAIAPFQFLTSPNLTVIATPLSLKAV